MTNWLGQNVQQYIQPTDTVLDLGCGIMQATDDLICKSILGVDIFTPYLSRIKHLWSTFYMDITSDQLKSRFVDSSYDIVLLLDLLEHLEEIEVKPVIMEGMRIARKKVIIFTPLDFHTQATDSWGMGENPHQQHRCLVSKVMLSELGFKLEKGEGLFGVWTK